MSWFTSLYIGNSFAEASVRIGSETLSQRRFLPHSSLGNFLKELTQELKPEGPAELTITSKFPGQVLHKGLGNSPAFLVTSGFEHWLDINLPVKIPHFSIYPEKVASPMDLDLVFGISERVNDKGTVEKQVSMEDLDFIQAKLKMLNVTQIAIGFLHGAVNPKNEKIAAKFFEENGFEVFLSHKMLPTENEKSRWWQAYLNAYLSLACKENENELTALAKEVGYESVTYCNADLKENHKRSEVGFLASVFDPCFVVAKALARKKVKKSVVYFGLEDFWLFSQKKGMRSQWPSDLGKIVIETPWVDRLKIQPTTNLQDCFWGVPELTGSDLGFEPGPIAMGKGLRLTFIDVLFSCGVFGDKDIEQSVDGFSDLLSFKAKPRIDETLQVLSKLALDMGDSSGGQVNDWVKDSLLDQLAIELVSRTQGQKILAVGPLAQIMIQVLKQHNKNLKLELLEDGCPYLLSRERLETEPNI